MKVFRAVIFDFDGTLAKSMEDNYRAWKAAVSEHGAELLAEDYYLLEGTRVKELAGWMNETFDLQLNDPEKLAEKKEAHYLANHRFELYPGAATLVRSFRRSAIPIAMVTAGTRQRITGSAPADFLAEFDAIVTAEDTQKGKPDPEPYLKGAEKLGVKIEECVVVENAPLGVASAKRAGAYCIALCTTLSGNHLSGADKTAQSMAELLNSGIISRLFNGRL